MGIYLGNVGSIEITRKSSTAGKASVVNPSDVNAAKDRFSFDFEQGTLLTGDLVEIKTTDGTLLDFVDATGWADSTVYDRGNWYIFVDDLGGIRLYQNFDDSLVGETTGLVPLVAITRDIPIVATVQSSRPRLLGCISDYELNTSREVVDITVLSDQYRQQYSSLITGSGSLTAQWDYARSDGQESVHYLMQLVLRTEIGSDFKARFFIKSRNTSASAGSFESAQLDDALWWEFDGLVTSSATSFEPGSIIVSRIEFVATGPIKLLARTAGSNYILKEDNDFILLEQDPTAKLELEYQ
jgi:hypothetical protein